MKLRPLAVLVAAAVFSTALVSAQAKPGDAPPATPRPADAKPEAPKPPGELDSLSYFLGPWTFEGEMKPGPTGPGGATKGREICRWMPGRFFMGCMMETQSPAGVMEVQAIMGWDAEKKVYRWWSFDNTGRAESATGTLKDGTWTWSGESKMDGKNYKTRYTISDTKPEGYAFQFESSPDGKGWTPVMTSKATKVTPRPMPTAAAGVARPPAGTPVPAVTPVPTKSP